MEKPIRRKWIDTYLAMAEDGAHAGFVRYLPWQHTYIEAAGVLHFQLMHDDFIASASIKEIQLTEYGGRIIVAINPVVERHLMLPDGRLELIQTYCKLYSPDVIARMLEFDSFTPGRAS